MITIVIFVFDSSLSLRHFILLMSQPYMNSFIHNFCCLLLCLNDLTLLVGSKEGHPAYIKYSHYNS